MVVDCLLDSDIHRCCPGRERSDKTGRRALAVVHLSCYQALPVGGNLRQDEARMASVCNTVNPCAYFVTVKTWPIYSSG